LTYINNEIYASTTSFQQLSHTQIHHLISSMKINTYNNQFSQINQNKYVPKAKT